MVKTVEIFSLLFIVIISVTILFGFLFLTMSTMKSSKTINALLFRPGFYPSIFYRHPAYYLNIQLEHMDHSGF